MQKFIIGAIAIGVTAVGMRIAGVSVGDVLKLVRTDASNAAADIKALVKGDFKQQRKQGEALTPKVGANDGDYDAEMKKELAEERQKFLEERRKAIDKVMSTATDTDALRKQIEQNVKDSAGKQ